MTILWGLASSLYAIATNESTENSKSFVWNPQSTIFSYSNATDNHTNASTAADGKKGGEEEDQEQEVEDRYRRFYELAQFITGLVFYPTFCLFGLTGNILSVVVLRGRKSQSPTNAFLIALSVSDGIKLLNDLLYFIVILALHIRPVSGERLLCVLYPYAHYFFNMSVCITAWITVALAAERYILVCHAARAKQICNITRTHVTIAMVFVSMTVISIPSALRYKTVYHYYSDNSGEYDISINVTELWSDKNFVTVYSWTQNMLRSLVPLTVLCVLNCFIVQALRRTRRPPSARPSPQRHSKVTHRHRITVMLVSVIVVFIVCVTPDAIMSTVFGFGYYDSNDLVRAVREITDLLLTVNSATNFVLYCAFNKVFRHRFRKIVVGSCCRGRCCWRRRRRRRDGSLADPDVLVDTYVIQTSMTQKSHRCEMLSKNGCVPADKVRRRSNRGPSLTLCVPAIVAAGHRPSVTWTTESRYDEVVAKVNEDADVGVARSVVCSVSNWG